MYFPVNNEAENTNFLPSLLFQISASFSFKGFNLSAWIDNNKLVLFTLRPMRQESTREYWCKRWMVEMWNMAG
jgi:hypothetical protein